MSSKGIAHQTEIVPKLYSKKIGRPIRVEFGPTIAKNLSEELLPNHDHRASLAELTEK